MNQNAPTPDFGDRLSQVRQRIAAACEQHGRKSAEVMLLAVSKTFPASDVAALAGCGQQSFGENYVQEGVDKIITLRAAGLEHLIWHFIGPLQSNKTKPVAEHFDWVHTVDREKIAQRLSEQRPTHLPPLNICLQVKTSTEQSKHGLDASTLDALAASVARLPRLVLRGLMTLPEPGNEASEFAQLRELFLHMKKTYPSLDTLSMGMSADLETAIEHGSTCVRVGTALFGHRTPKGTPPA